MITLRKPLEKEGGGAKDKRPHKKGRRAQEERRKE